LPVGATTYTGTVFCVVGGLAVGLPLPGIVDWLFEGVGESDAGAVVLLGVDVALLVGLSEPEGLAVPVAFEGLAVLEVGVLSGVVAHVASVPVAVAVGESEADAGAEPPSSEPWFAPSDAEVLAEPAASAPSADVAVAVGVPAAGSVAVSVGDALAVQAGVAAPVCAAAGRDRIVP
jgi:hypothetical protein